MIGNETIKNRVFKLYSLQFLIAVACIVVSILPMTYTGFSVYSKYAKQLVGNSEIFADQIMEQVRINIEEYIESGIKVNNDVGALIGAQGGELNNDTLAELNVYYSTRNDISSISIASINGSVINLYQNLKSKKVILLQMKNGMKTWLGATLCTTFQSPCTEPPLWQP